MGERRGRVSRNRWAGYWRKQYRKQCSPSRGLYSFPQRPELRAASWQHWPTHRRGRDNARCSHSAEADHTAIHKLLVLFQGWVGLKTADQKWQIGLLGRTYKTAIACAGSLSALLARLASAALGARPTVPTARWRLCVVGLQLHFVGRPLLQGL